MSSQTLRQRSTMIESTSCTTPTQQQQQQSQNRPQASGLSLQSLQRSSPQYMGEVQKLHIPFLYTILPYFLQRILLQYSCFNTILLRPVWQSRYLIVLGSYLYKFKRSYKNCHGKYDEQQQPNGSPVRLDHMNVYIVSTSSSSSSSSLSSINNEDYIAYLASKTLQSHNDTSNSTPSCIFCVSTFRKKYYYACTNPDDTIVWVNTLHEASEECVKRNMGHASHDSYPSTKWNYYDTLGQELMNRKDRIRNKVQQSTLREFELSQMNDGGPIPRGYYG